MNFIECIFYRVFLFLFFLCFNVVFQLFILCYFKGRRPPPTQTPMQKLAVVAMKTKSYFIFCRAILRQHTIVRILCFMVVHLTF